MKLKLLLLLLATSLFAQNGEEIFNTNCKSCHIMKKGWQLTSADKAKLKAPTAFGITKHVRDIFKNEELFVEFVNDYITYPAKIKSRCKTNVVKQFGLMPAIGKSMSEEDRKTVANWMFENL
jgi:cytochrome c5